MEIQNMFLKYPDQKELSIILFEKVTEMLKENFDAITQRSKRKLVYKCVICILEKHGNKNIVVNGAIQKATIDNVQVLLFRVGRWNIVKALPILITGVFAAWGTYLYFTSLHWSNATFWGSLIADYVSPFISCLATLIVLSIAKLKKVYLEGEIG